MSYDPRPRPTPAPSIGQTIPVLLHQPLSPDDVARTMSYRVNHAPSATEQSTDPAILSTRLALPAYAVLTDAHSRMKQVCIQDNFKIHPLIDKQPQFLNRDTYGSLPGIDRRKEGESTYQLVYDVAADVRERFANGQETQCRPFTISAAQSEFLGTIRDANGRESLNFVALNANIGGYNTVTQQPFIIKGHVETTVYIPPSSSTMPWALEAPCPTRLSLQQALDNYESHERPFFAHPINSTSIRPMLDYLQPQSPYRELSSSLANPAGNSPQDPNVPRLKYCIPPIEADTQETGRAIFNSTITHGLWQPTPHYQWHTVPPNEPHPREGTTWEFMGCTVTGAQRWREFCPDGPPSPVSPTTSHREDSLMPFRGELPDVPDDTENLTHDFTAPYVDFPNRQKYYDKTTSRKHSFTPISGEGIVVQVPDKRDRYSRPIARYIVAPRHEEEFDRLSRVAADLARDIRRTQRERPSMPHLFLRTPISRRHTHPFSAAELYEPEDNDISSSIESLPSTHLGDNSDEDAEGSPEYEYVNSDSDSDEEEESSEEFDIEFMLSPPLRPSESGDSYFPRQLSRPSTPYVSLPPSPRPSPPLLHVSSSANPSRRPNYHQHSSSWERPVTISDSEDDVNTHSSSTESVCSAMGSNGEDLLDDPLELMYPPTPPPTRPPLLWRHISQRNSPEPNVLAPSPLVRGLSLSPLILPSALINLPHTTPIARIVPSLHLGTSLSNFAQAALIGAEKVLNGFKLTPVLSTSVALKEMEDRIAGLERTQQALRSPPLQDPSTKFPFTEDEDAHIKASDELASLLANGMRAPHVYRAEVAIPTIDTELLLGFSKGKSIPIAIRDSPIRSSQQASLSPRPSYTPAPSPIFPSRLAQTLDDDIFARPKSPAGSITESEAEVIAEIFNWDDYEDEEYRAAGEWIKIHQGEWLDDLVTEEVARQAEKREAQDSEIQFGEWIDTSHDYWYAEKQIEEMARQAEEQAREEEFNEKRVWQNSKQPIPSRPKSRRGSPDDESKARTGKYINVKIENQAKISMKEFVTEIEMKERAHHSGEKEMRKDEFSTRKWDYPVLNERHIERIEDLVPRSEKADQESRPGYLDDSWARPSTQPRTLPTEQTLWGPSSRRPMRNELGHISYDRTKNGCPDYMNGNPPWPNQERRRAEVLGYALEFPDSAVLQAHVKFRTRLASNLHQEQLLHTERRVRLEAEHNARQRNSNRLITPLSIDVYPDAHRRSTTPNSDNARLTEYTLTYRPEAHYFSPGYDYSQDFSSLGFPDLPPIISRRILEYEHAKRTQLAIIDRSTRHRYEGSFANTGSAENSFKDHDEQPTKRRKIHAPPLGNQVVSAEAFKVALINWQPHIAGLRDFRNDIFFTIQRLIEAVEYLDGRIEFRKIFFPFEEKFDVHSVNDMYDMEHSLNPDGFFRRASYHLNSLLHDAEANFLQSCATFFRATRDYELAYILEELLSMQFRDDMGVMQLLRGGFIATTHDLDGGHFDSSYGNLRDRLEECENQNARRPNEAI
ncbi:hypothetical protein C8F04DRAFT_1172689 [Mycena alexandri]|uniref:Uncharacterized protein n=1 Tax=Mycena alexandri TaxID=1745969 RepID=A0AAD6TKA4_9AGAR|nr:hypothetical protein C8F04DRAFT_1172687 [Mycena alexandri]KAJ7046875.1 hypothetical protein C8F04DRAFT_1172689 [Mycena alexandri]